MPRIAGKYGRKPFDPSRPRLVLEKYLDPRAPLSRAGLPPVPRSQDVDRASDVQAWPMYLNDQLGDCTIAALGHMYEAWTAYAGSAYGGVLFSDDQIQSVYSRVGGYDPSQTQPDGSNPTDQGCLLSDVLADNKANGITDVNGKVHKVLGYASFGNAADETLLGQVLDVFGTVYVGINVQPSIQDEFSEGVPWTYTHGEPFEGGHAICLQRRFGSGQGVLEYVTWGALQRATTGFQAHCAEEAWAPVTEDWVAANGTSVEGLDLQQLLADMAAV